MKNKDITIFDLLIETHKSLERQGPGSPEMTLRALSFVENLNEKFTHSRFRLRNRRSNNGPRTKYRWTYNRRGHGA